MPFFWVWTAFALLRRLRLRRGGKAERSPGPDPRRSGEATGAAAARRSAGAESLQVESALDEVRRWRARRCEDAFEGAGELRLANLLGHVPGFDVVRGRGESGSSCGTAFNHSMTSPQVTGTSPNKSCKFGRTMPFVSSQGGRELTPEVRDTQKRAPDRLYDLAASSI